MWLRLMSRSSANAVSTPSATCVELKSSTRLQWARMRRSRCTLFGRASSTRRERSLRPNISRIDFDVTEIERCDVLPDASLPLVDFHTVGDLAEVREDVVEPLAAPEAEARAPVPAQRAEARAERVADAGEAHDRRPGQHTGATCPTSKAPISAAFRSLWLIFGRAMISRSGLEARMLVPERARAERSATSNLSVPAQVLALFPAVFLAYGLLRLARNVVVAVLSESVKSTEQVQREMAATLSEMKRLARGSTRERNSQLQRLRSRPCSTRFGCVLDERSFFP